MPAVTRFGIDGAIWSPVGDFSGKEALEAAETPSRRIIVESESNRTITESETNRVITESSSNRGVTIS